MKGVNPVESTEVLKAVRKFLSDRRDDDFAPALKTFLLGSNEEKLQAFILSLTCAKVFGNVIVDRGELTPQTALLVPTLEIQMVKLLEEQQSHRD